MLPKRYRLNSKKDFDRIYKEKGARGPFFIVKSISNKKGHLRIGIVVGKKVSAKSSERNLIRRRISEILYKELRNIKGKSIIVSLLPRAYGASYADLKEEVVRIFRKAKLFNNEENYN